MQWFYLLLSEIKYRIVNFLLAAVAVTTAATLLIVGPTLLDGYQAETQQQMEAYQTETDQKLRKMEDETRKLMLGLGFNLRIFHKDTNMADFLAADFTTTDMPQEYVQILADSPKLTRVTHLVATIHRKVKWNGRNVLLSGYLPETQSSHKEHKKPMGYVVEPGTVILGFEVGYGLKEGEEIEILGKKLKIHKILQEAGNKRDISVITSLQDAQEMLDKKGRITQILALNCKCKSGDLPKIRQELESILPDTKVIEDSTKAIARAEQRELVKKHRKEAAVALQTEHDKTRRALQMLNNIAIPLIVLVCAIWVGLLALANVRDRRQEIGLLRAVGSKTSKVAALFMGRAVLLGICGAVAGCLLGSILAKFLGSQPTLDIPKELLTVRATLVIATILGAPLIAAVASYLPTIIAIRQDPAVVLRDQ